MISGLTLPPVTALTALGFQIATPGYSTKDGPTPPSWILSAVVAFFALSLVANALLTSLIVYKIVSVYRNIRGFGKTRTVYGNGLRSDLYPLISILVESGVITCTAQLVQSAMYKAAPIYFPIISGAVVMIFVRALFVYFVF